MKGIYWKIFFTFLSASLLATVITLVYAVAYRQLSNDTANLIAPTTGYISSAELVLQRGGEPLLMEWLISMEKYPHVNAYVFDGTGNSLLASNVPEQVIQYAFASDRYQAQINPLSSSEVLVKAPLQSLDQQYYLLVIELVHPFIIEGLYYYVLMGFVIAVIIFALIATILSRYLTRPIFSLQSSVKALSHGDLTVRPRPRLLKRSDEIGDLSREVNHMADQIEQLMADQKLLLRDVSHELRSPLARLQVANELARMDLLEEQASAAANLDRIELEGNRLNEMIEDLLVLARTEIPSRQALQAVDITAVVQAVCHDAEFEQQQKLIQLEISEQPLLINADAKLLASAMENLIRNALLHTAKGTQVEVSIKKLDSNKKPQLEVIIRDHGAGVEADAIPHLTKPFYRAEASRQRNPEDERVNKHRGFGLGLSIAERTVKYCQGSMQISNHQEGGLMINCRFPLSVAAKGSQK